MCINYALLGFDLCHFGRHNSVKRFVWPRIISNIKKLLFNNAKPNKMESDVFNLMIYNDLITSLITLKLILENIDTISIIKDLEIYNELEELELLQENLRIRTLRNRFLGRPNKIEEEIELREQKRKKIVDIEELKKEVEEWEFKVVKLLQDLNYEKHDEIVEIRKKK